MKQTTLLSKILEVVINSKGFSFLKLKKKWKKRQRHL
jgi:hypothetical protein